MTKERVIRKVSGLLSADKVLAAFQAQSVLFEKFISMARSPDEPEVIKTMLRETIGISTELTGAELGSLILLDSDGLVIDSILSRGEISPELSSMLIKSVLERGLAGWVMRHRKMGLVNDTEKDDRWLILPDQPYIARSALAVPIISNDMLLGVLTLMHSMPDAFYREDRGAHQCHRQPDGDDIGKCIPVYQPQRFCSVPWKGQSEARDLFFGTRPGTGEMSSNSK